MGDCSKCTARCCNYTTFEIPSPRARADFDELLWQVAHKNVLVYVDEGDWFLCFETPCEFLQPDFSCGIYETRPQTCRDYKPKDCDYDGEHGAEMEFRTYAQFKKYMDVRFSQGGAKKVRKKDFQKQFAPNTWVAPQLVQIERVNWKTEPLLKGLRRGKGAGKKSARGRKAVG